MSPFLLRNAVQLGFAATLPLLAPTLLEAGKVQAGEQPPAATAELAASGDTADTGSAEAGNASAELAQAPEEGETAPAPADEPSPGTAEPPAGESPTEPESVPPEAVPPEAAPLPDGATPEITPPEAQEPRARLSEIVIEGLEGHPERQRIEQAAYAALTVVPGSQVTRSELRKDLAAVYATGWFSDVRMDPVDVPGGVRLVVRVTPNPALTRVQILPDDVLLPQEYVEEVFAGDYGRTINLVTVQNRINELQKWYADQGYSLARVTGPARVSPEGEIQLTVRQGIVEGVEVQFLNKDGEATNENGKPVRGKTKEWVITREISLQSGDIFNRQNLEEDLRRLYGTGLFSDVKVTLRPSTDDPGRVTIVLGMVEQSTGSLSGGIGYSQSQGVFGQVQVQESNLLGRAWNLATSFTYGQFGGLFDLSLTDPWIKGDRYRTGLRLKAFFSREVPQVFQSNDNGDILTARDFYEAPGTKVAYNIDSRDNPLDEDFSNVDEARGADDNISWFDVDGGSIVLQRAGGNIQLVRPLNGGDPFKKAPWTLILGLSGQQVRPIDFSGNTRRYGITEQDLDDNEDRVPTDSIICVAYNCASSNTLVGLRLAATRNLLDDPRNPTRGSFLSLATEQFVSVGENSPTFNRLRASYTFYIPVNWIRFYRGCRPKPGEPEDCRQALAFNFSAGTNIGDLPPYEAFCIGGGNSVRGYSDCDLGVGKSFGEFTVEYRFPIFRILSGELFFDAGSAFGTQDDVEGNIGELLDKPGNGFSVGTGVIVTTPVGPLRLEVASRDFTGDWRFNLGVGWKF